MVLAAADYDERGTDLCARARHDPANAGWWVQHLKARRRPPDGGWDLGSAMVWREFSGCA